jgi:hypothetical protein
MRSSSPAPPKILARVNVVLNLKELRYGPRSVLGFLALRYNPKYGYAWPSVGKISKKLGMSETSVKSFLNLLERKYKYIHREYRNGSRSKSRKCYIMWDKIEADGSKVDGGSPEDGGEVQLSNTNPPSKEEQAIADTLGDPGFSTEIPDLCGDATVGDILSLLEQTFPKHPTYQRDDAVTILTACVRSCLATAGSGTLCLLVFQWVLGAPEKQGIRDYIGGSDMLGGYIQSSFLGWKDAYKEIEARELMYCSSVLKYMYGRGPEATFPLDPKHKVQRFCTWVRDKMGDHLKHVSLRQELDGCVLRLEMSPWCWSAWILETHANQLVSPWEIQDLSADNLPAMCAWAVEHETWAGLLKDPHDVVASFREHYTDIHRGYLASTETDIEEVYE